MATTYNYFLSYGGRFFDVNNEFKAYTPYQKTWDKLPQGWMGPKAKIFASEAEALAIAESKNLDMTQINILRKEVVSDIPSPPSK